MDFFLTKYGHESRVFFTEWTFFTKYGYERIDFSWKIFMKNLKKGNPIDFFSLYYFWQNWRFFNQIRAWWQEFFHTNLKKMTWEHYVLERMDVFSTKMGITSVFFKEWTFFTKYWHESDGFFLTNWKKRASYWFFWSII